MLIPVYPVFHEYNKGKPFAKDIKEPHKALYETYEPIVKEMASCVKLGEVAIPVPTKRTFDYTKLLCLWMYRYYKTDFRFPFEKPEPYENFCDIKQKPDFCLEMLPNINFTLTKETTVNTFEGKSGIVLIDNVYDTGKTAHAAIEALRKVTDLPISVSVIALGKYYEKGIGYNTSVARLNTKPTRKEC